jgi:hypothetical protein
MLQKTEQQIAKLALAKLEEKNKEQLKILEEQQKKLIEDSRQEQMRIMEETKKMKQDAHQELATYQQSLQMVN